MMMAITPNMFSMESVQGSIDLKMLNNVITGIISSSETATLVAGQAVKIEDSAGGVPKFLATTADTDHPFGFVVRNLKDASFVALDKVEIAIAGTVMTMTASAAIARGAFVEVVTSSKKVKTSAGVNPIIGIALDKVTTDGDLVRVMILVPNVSSSAVFTDAFITDDLTVTDDVSIGGDLAVTGAAAITGNSTVGGTLGVTGDVTLSADLSVGVDLAVTGNATVGGTLGVTGDVTLAADLSVGVDLGVTGDATIGGTLGVTGEITATADINASADINVTGLVISDVNDYSAGAGALPIDKGVIALTTGGAEALTLADGVDGQELEIVMVSDGGDGTVTPANFANGTTITFDDVGDSVRLRFLTDKWYSIGTATATIA